MTYFAGLSVSQSLVDGFSMGLGLLFVLLALGVLRELIAILPPPWSIGWSNPLIALKNKLDTIMKKTIQSFPIVMQEKLVDVD